MALLLNCDLGEIVDTEHRVELAMMPLIDHAYIACALHAGSPEKIRSNL